MGAPTSSSGSPPRKGSQCRGCVGVAPRPARLPRGVVCADTAALQGRLWAFSDAMLESTPWGANYRIGRDGDVSERLGPDTFVTDTQPLAVYLRAEGSAAGVDVLCVSRAIAEAGTPAAVKAPERLAFVGYTGSGGAYTTSAF